ncbi:hypothetical protein EU546_06335 [Candidatus Thorarchaeota archaeon]|nr:MAG: hypothetical protein EU546_06335 [Candidatus Thorarchaeota archaeon]
MQEDKAQPKGLPVTREQAKQSRKKLHERFELIRSGLMIRGHVYPRPLGLTRAVYVGRAYTWPNRFTAWSVRLGDKHSDRTWLHVWMMPPKAFSRVTRVIRNAREITWSGESINLNLYDPDSDSWTVNMRWLKYYTSGASTLQKLLDEWGRGNEKPYHSLNRDQAKALDMMHYGLQLYDLELGAIQDYLGLTTDEIWEHASQLEKAGVLDLTYRPSTWKTVSVASIATGPEDRVYSMVRGFLKHTPNSSVMLTDKGTRCILLSRLPPSALYDFATQMPETAAENDINLRIMETIEYRTYTANLFQRIMREEGSWDSDVSEITSQVSLPNASDLS